MKKYIPIACGFHDYLEHYATLRETVTVMYRAEDKDRTVRGVIRDLTGGREGEYVVFQTDQEVLTIRMDFIRQLNEHTPPEESVC